MQDKKWDRALGIQTGGREEEKGGRSMPYEPTPYTVLDRLARGGWIGKEDHLLDYGCGKGRAVFFLARQTGCRATGLDHSSKLIAMAEENRLGFAGRDRINFVCARAQNYAPRQENLFFFFNPFSREVLDVVLRQILGAGGRSGKRKRLIFYYPTREYLARLEEDRMLTLAGVVDCRDLFEGKDLREKIVIYDVPENEEEDTMETRYYVVERIDGDYAWLRRTDVQEEDMIPVARALLPESTDEGVRLKYEMLQYEVMD